MVEQICTPNIIEKEEKITSSTTSTISEILALWSENDSKVNIFPSLSTFNTHMHKHYNSNTNSYYDYVCYAAFDGDLRC